MLRMSRTVRMGALAMFTVFGCINTVTCAMYSGFLGCKFDASVCQPNEFCVDDRLFGNCQSKMGVKDRRAYLLDHQTLRRMEFELNRLEMENFRWTDLYTQCVVGNVLLTFRENWRYDPDLCTRGAVPLMGHTDKRSREQRTGETLALLEKYFNNYYDQLQQERREQRMRANVIADAVEEARQIWRSQHENPDPRQGENYQYSDEYSKDKDTGEDYAAENFDELGNVDKRDQFVDVHKLLKNKREKERLSDAPAPPISSWSKRDMYTTDYDVTDDDDDVRPGAVEAMAARLKPEALSALKSYLSKSPSESSENYQYSADEIETNSGPAGYALSEDAETAVVPQTEELVSSDDAQVQSANDPDLLAALVAGRLSIDDLSDVEIDRLISYVDHLLRELATDPASPITTPGFERDRASANYDYSTLSGDDAPKGNFLGEPEAQLMKSIMRKAPALIAPTGDNTAKLPVDPDVADMLLEPAVAKATNEDKVLPDAADLVKKDVIAEPDHHDHSFFDESEEKTRVTSAPSFDVVNANYVYFTIKPPAPGAERAAAMVRQLAQLMRAPLSAFSEITYHNGDIVCKINPRSGFNSTYVAAFAERAAGELKNRTGLEILNAGIGRDEHRVSVVEAVRGNAPRLFVLTFVLCGLVAGIVLAVVAIFLLKRHVRAKEKLSQIANNPDNVEATKDYQDLCRQRMQAKQTEKPEPMHVAARMSSVGASEVRSPSSRSSTSSWSEEPATTNMDISTGHIVLSYMEEHMADKDRLHREWEALVAYEAEPNDVTVGSDAANVRKNRYPDVLPFDHSRVKLNCAANISGSDYINASSITDHDPRNPAYIVTQGPLPHTVADFWQMVWEQGSVVLVNLTKLTENGQSVCHSYWPAEGSDLYHIYEVHLVSEHIWCEDFLVRSFYLKNLQTSETRTVTQFHFQTWPDMGVPSGGQTKALLDFRRKVNKSYRGRSCPIIVHCSDGVGRSGTYCLLDMVLNRMSKGAKELDIAASLEHIRDQRANMVKTKEQFEFVLSAVAEEVHAILKAIPQQQ